MRFLNKYKLHAHYGASDVKLPRRILQFNRPKWEKIQKKYNRRLKKIVWIKKWIKRRIKIRTKTGIKIRKIAYKTARRTRFRKRYVNHIIIYPRRKFNVQRFFKTKQLIKKYIASSFENTINFRKKNNYKDRLSSVSSYIIKPFFRLDILLWYLKFFMTSVEAKAFINGRNVLVNDRVVNSNYELKKGDVISINFFKLTLKIARRNLHRRIRKRFKKSNSFFPFLERDHYTNKIIILKNWNELSVSELAITIKTGRKLKYAFYD